MSPSGTKEKLLRVLEDSVSFWSKGHYERKIWVPYAQVPPYTAALCRYTLSPGLSFHCSVGIGAWEQEQDNDTLPIAVSNKVFLCPTLESQVCQDPQNCARLTCWLARRVKSQMLQYSWVLEMKMGGWQRHGLPEEKVEQFPVIQ